MKRKIYVAIIISFLMIFENINVVYCSGLEDLYGLNAVYTGLEHAITTQEKANAISDWIHKNSESVGFLFDFTAPMRPLSFLIDICPQSWIDNLSSDPTEEEIYDAVVEGITSGQTVSNNNVVNDNSVNTFIKNFTNYYVEQNGPFYGYTCSISSNNIYSTYQTALENFLSEYDEDYYVYAWSSGQYISVVPKNAYYGVLKSQTNDLYIVDTNVYYQIEGQYQYRYVNGAYVQNGTVNDFTGERTVVKEKGSSSFDLYHVNLISLDSYPFPIYPTGSNPTYVKPYYYNNSVWQDFSSSIGDYTVTTSNINTVTYGDTVSYINDYHDTNNNYPDNSVVNNWITTTNNNNISNGGSGDDNGGGSGDDNGGGSGDDNGGNGSGDDDSGSIFDWLKTLGKAIGDLISGVGNFLSEIVAGLVDAITNLLDAITTLITGVLESLTNIFSGLIEFIFAGLPDDIRNVLSLALTVAILISVLKLIRGN